MRRRIAVIAAVLLGALGTLALATTTAGADCSNSSCRADVGMWGSAIPSPITPSTSSTSQLYFYGKNNGPNSAYGIVMHITVPYQLHIISVRDYDAAQQCTVKGTFVSCYLGNYKREQYGTIVIKVRPTGRKGTYEIPGTIYSDADDPNGGNNQCTATLAVYQRGHGG